MNEENQWKNISKDFSDITNKIKENLINDESVNDLKETLETAKNSIKNNFSDLMAAIEDTVKDEEIKKEALMIVKKTKEEFSKSFENIKDKIPNTYTVGIEESDLNEEE